MYIYARVPYAGTAVSKAAGAHIDSQVTVEYNNADTLAKAKKAARPKEVAKPAPPVKRTREDPKTQAKATGSTGPIAPTAKSPSQAVPQQPSKKAKGPPPDAAAPKHAQITPPARQPRSASKAESIESSVDAKTVRAKSAETKAAPAKPSAKHAATPRAKSAPKAKSAPSEPPEAAPKSCPKVKAAPKPKAEPAAKAKTAPVAEPEAEAKAAAVPQKKAKGKPKPPAKAEKPTEHPSAPGIEKAAAEQALNRASTTDITGNPPPETEADIVARKARAKAHHMRFLRSLRSLWLSIKSPCALNTHPATYVCALRQDNTG